MKLHSRFAAVSSIFLGLTLHAVSSQGASVFDWNNFTYSGATVTPTNKNLVGNSTDNSNSLSLQYATSGGATFSTLATSPASASSSQGAYYSSGGNSGTQKYLQTVVDFANSTQSMTITLFFATPVVSLSFSIFDVDSGTVSGGAYQDRISAIYGLGTDGATLVSPQSLTNIGAGTTNTIDSVNQATAISQSSAAQTANAGNITATFNSTTPITQLSFVYGDTVASATAHSAVQLIGLSNIAFTNVPEPGTTAMLGLGTVGLWAMAYLRRR